MSRKKSGDCVSIPFSQRMILGFCQLPNGKNEFHINSQHIAYSIFWETHVGICLIKSKRICFFITTDDIVSTTVIKIKISERKPLIFVGMSLTIGSMLSIKEIPFLTTCMGLNILDRVSSNTKSESLYCISSIYEM